MRKTSHSGANSATQKSMPIQNSDNTEQGLLNLLEEKVAPLRMELDLKPLIDQVSNAKIVMLGEASHGTQEFYEWRRLITEWLMVKHGFRFVAVEGDWPACYEVNRYIQSGQAGNSEKTLRHFNRWPTWMWANTEIARLVEWMRTQNELLPESQKLGFFGLDVYSLFDSISVVLKQLEKINPFLAKKARNQYECFDIFNKDERAYAKSLIDFPEGCENQVVAVLESLLKTRIEGQAGSEKAEALFDATQNARIIANGELYYRTMIHGNEDSWNVRDRHMMETLDVLLNRFGPDTKAIVWAHNTHIGDYRATSMAKEGQVNIGGLARQEWGQANVALVGFGTYQGEVIASHSWDGPTTSFSVPKGKPGSFEDVFHKTARIKDERAFILNLRDTFTMEQSALLAQPRGHRAIGVVYHPRFEHFGNYVPTVLSERYDAFLFFDETHALKPLDVEFRHENIPETWPQGQ